MTPDSYANSLSGRILVLDDEHIFGYSHTRNRLFGAEIGKLEPPRSRSAPRNSPQGRQAANAAATLWTNAKNPTMVRALVLATDGDSTRRESNRLVLAGPPVAGFGNPQILRGEEGGLLEVVDAATGRSLSQIPLEAPPIFDGMCVARGSVVLTLTSGAVACFK